MMAEQVFNQTIVDKILKVSQLVNELGMSEVHAGHSYAYSGDDAEEVVMNMDPYFPFNVREREIDLVAGLLKLIRISTIGSGSLSTNEYSDGIPMSKDLSFEGPDLVAAMAIGKLSRELKMKSSIEQVSEPNGYGVKPWRLSLTVDKNKEYAFFPITSLHLVASILRDACHSDKVKQRLQEQD